MSQINGSDDDIVHDEVQNFGSVVPSHPQNSPGRYSSAAAQQQSEKVNGKTVIMLAVTAT